MRHERGTLGYFKELFELAPAAYIVTDVHLAIQDANTAAVKLLRRQLDLPELPLLRELEPPELPEPLEPRDPLDPPESPDLSISPSLTSTRITSAQLPMKA